MNRIALLLVFVLLFPHGGSAQQAEIGTGLVCDTKEQIELFVRLANSGMANEAAIGKVNAGTNACGILTVAYVRGDKVGTVHTKEGRADIVNIVVIAVHQDGLGWIHSVPVGQYTLFTIASEQGA